MSWAKAIGYKGKIYYRWDDVLSVVVFENILRTHERYEVHHWSREDSRYESLSAAKTRALQLMVEPKKGPVFGEK
jgi:hypothetical protein